MINFRLCILLLCSFVIAEEYIGIELSDSKKELSQEIFKKLNNEHYIKEIDKDDINYARRLGYKIKLLGYAELIGKNIFQRVHPTLIRDSSYVASIDGVLNAVIIDGNPVGQSIIPVSYTHLTLPTIYSV